MDDNKDDDQKLGKIISFPNGTRVPTDELGGDHIIGTTGHMSVPEVIDPNEISKDVKDREEFVSKQELYKSVSEKVSSSLVVDTILKEIAEELSHLKYERKKAAKEGKNTAHYTISRIASLKQLADVLMKRMESNRAEQLDLKSPRFKTVLRVWLEFVYESMQKCDLPDQTIDLVLRTMESDMVEWEKKVLESV